MMETLLGIKIKTQTEKELYDLFIEVYQHGNGDMFFELIRECSENKQKEFIEALKRKK